MSTPRRVTPEDLALYAMQLLSNEESAEVTAFLETSADARRELAQIQGDLAVYAYSVDLHAPAPQVKERLLKQVAKEKRIAPIKLVEEETVNRTGALQPRSEPPVRGSGADSRAEGRADSRAAVEELPKRNGANVAAWIGWTIAAGLAVATGLLYRERLDLQTTIASQTTQLDQLTTDAATAKQALDTLNDPTALRVTLSKGKETPVPQGRVTYVADKGTLIFLASNLDPLPPFKTYELWLIPATAGRDPIPAGTFHPDERGNASVILPALGKGVAAKAFGVTIEDKDGATTPTLPIILIGA